MAIEVHVEQRASAEGTVSTLIGHLVREQIFDLPDAT